MRDSIASAFHQAASVSRAELYGTECDSQLPLNLKEDARVPFLGFCGPNFETGNPVLLAINPGGGVDTYQERNAEDQELIPLIKYFLQAEPSKRTAAFESMSKVFMTNMQKWSLKNIMNPTKDACGMTVEEICYLNLFPYRTRTNNMPSAKAREAAWNNVVTPLLTVLRPRFLIALGKKAGGVAERFSIPPTSKLFDQLFVVQRTNGDRFVCDEAQATLELIRKATAHLNQLNSSHQTFCGSPES